MIFKPENIKFEVRGFLNEIQPDVVANLFVSYADGEIEKEAVFKIKSQDEIVSKKSEATEILRKVIESI